MWKAILSPDFFSTILRSATPILFATLASAIAANPVSVTWHLRYYVILCIVWGNLFIPYP